MSLDRGLPDGQSPNIGAGLDKAVKRWREPRQWTRLNPIGQPALFQLIENVNELAASETTKQ